MFRDLGDWGFEAGGCHTCSVHVCMYVAFWIFSVKHLLLFLIKTRYFIPYNYTSIRNFQDTFKKVTKTLIFDIQ